jgi:hypothetical protein
MQLVASPRLPADLRRRTFAQCPQTPAGFPHAIFTPRDLAEEISHELVDGGAVRRCVLTDDSKDLLIDA